MFKLDLEKAEEPEVKLPTSIGYRKRREFQKTICSASLTTLKLLILWITTKWKILKQMRIPDHLTYLLRNLYGGQEATVRTKHGTEDWFKTGKDCILSPYLFNLYAEFIM